jgi:uncharacterized protein YkwD
VRRLLAALLVVLVLGGASPAAGLGRPEARLLRMTNAARERHGLAALATGPRLNAAAERHARRMADARRIYHGGYGFPWRHCWGQNVGVGPTLRAVFRALLASPGHRANVLGRCYRRVGLGVVRSDGRVWVVQDFAG